MHSRTAEYAVFDTVLGAIGVARTSYGLVATTLPLRSRAEVLSRLQEIIRRARLALAEATPAEFGSLREEMRRYAAGGRPTFEVELDTRGWSIFQVHVWQATREIPYGQTRSYGWVARAAGSPRACRAAGQALHRNPFPIIVPCHRVIGADGSLTGFGGGLDAKKRLLGLEGVACC